MADALLTLSVYEVRPGRVCRVKPKCEATSEISPNLAPLIPRTLRLQNRMRKVVMKLPPRVDFLSEMAGMREWLDKHRCTPSMFKYHLEQQSVIIEVEFKEEEEAEIFKQYFDRTKTI